MKTFKKFDEISAWQKARQLNQKTYEMTDNNKAFNSDFGLKDQIRRSCISITSNIAEGFERESLKELSDSYIFLKHRQESSVHSNIWLTTYHTLQRKSLKNSVET